MNERERARSRCHPTENGDGQRVVKEEGKRLFICLLVLDLGTEEEEEKRNKEEEGQDARERRARLKARPIKAQVVR